MLRGEGGRRGKVGGSAPQTDSWVTHLRSRALEVREPDVGAQHQGVAFQTVSAITILVSSPHPQGPGPQWPPEQPIWASIGAMSKFVPDPAHAEKSAGRRGGTAWCGWMSEALHLLCAGSFAAGGRWPAPSPAGGAQGGAHAGQGWSPAGVPGPGLGKDSPIPCRAATSLSPLLFSASSCTCGQ